MSIVEIKSALKTAKSFQVEDNAEFKIFYKYLKNAMDSILKNPVEIVKNNDKVSEVIIFEHYKVKADKNNKLQLLIDFSAEPSNKFNEIDPIYVQRDTDLVEVSSNYDRDEVRHPRQNWLFDIQPSIQKKNEMCNYEKENIDDDDYKKNYTPYLIGEHICYNKINYKSLLFFIKTCAYFGVLEHLNNETIFMLAKHNSEMDFKGKCEADASDESKELLVQLLLLVRNKILAFKPSLLEGCFKLSDVKNKKQPKFKNNLRTINRKISDSLLSIMHEKQVLICLDNLYKGSHLINYLIAVNNIEKYRTGFELFKNESENLVNYILNFETKLSEFNNEKDFSLSNKVSDWSTYHNDLSFPEPQSLQNFKAFLQGNISAQKYIFEFIGMRVNSELIHGIKEKVKKEINEYLENNWICLIAWLTYGEEWKNCTYKDIFAFGITISHFEVFEFSRKFSSQKEAKNYSEKIAIFIDILVRFAKHGAVELNKLKSKNERLVGLGQLSKEEATEKNRKFFFNLIHEEEELLDFIVGSYVDKKGKKIPNISLITDKTTDKSLINKCKKWHKEKMLERKL